MVGSDVEVCSFLDAKLPGSRCMGQRVRKRSLAPWKVWRRHWCSVRKLGLGLGVEILLDRGSASDSTNHTRNNSIKVPSDAVICRTESRTKQFAFGIFTSVDRKPLLYLSGNTESETQRWMASLRELLRPRRHRFLDGTFNISLVDNAHSRASGLTGLHGDLVASRSGIFLKDVHSGDIIETFNWNEMNQFHLSSSGRTEDVKRICVMHTTREFRSGVGELYVFCMDASKLLQSLVTQGRGPKQKTVIRPLSLSEGDLRFSNHNSDEPNNYPAIKGKVTSNLINAGISLLISARSGSEVKLLEKFSEDSKQDKTGKILKKMEKMKYPSHIRAIDNEYQPDLGNLSRTFSSLEELDKPSPRRTSKISIASGIYAEILEDVDTYSTISRIHSKVYEDPEDLLFDTNTIPPPLPPRKRCESNSTRNGSISDDGLDSEGDTRSVTPITQDETTSTPEKKTSISIPIVDDSDYVPMSPRPKDFALFSNMKKSPSEEDIYMEMR